MTDETQHYRFTQMSASRRRSIGCRLYKGFSLKRTLPAGGRILRVKSRLAAWQSPAPLPPDKQPA
ncbi:hypothetical protein GCWU000324_00953 [Kingella oralis ATCC 51147]|uniref:Uncharacterized protein n=2 Tax=Kingella TaxID=32257 RepID=C4GFN7_9NEIS|nr:hypothetical protein GCWU000324_00953 [Kingella oralis ATCC 51147]